MPQAAWLPLAIAGTGIGSALSNKKSARTGEQSGTSTQTITQTLDPRAEQFADTLTQAYLGRLSDTLPAGFEERGIAGINETYGAGMQGLQSRLAQMGLAGSPVAGNAVTQAEIGRLGSIGQFEAGLPAYEQQLRDQYLRDAGAFFTTLPRSQTVTGTQQGTYTQPGSMFGSAFSDAGTMLAYFLGRGLLGGGTGTGSTPFNPLSQNVNG